MEFNLKQFLISISFVLDYIEIDILDDITNHSKRVAYLSLKLNYLFVNKKVAEFYNKYKDEIIEKNDYQISDKKFANTHRQNDNMVRSENKRIVKEVEWDDRIYKITKFPVELLDKSYGVGAFIEDVTERIE